MDNKRPNVSEYEDLDEMLYEDEENKYHSAIQNKIGKTEKSVKTIFGVIIAALAVLVVLLIVFFSIKNGKKNKTEETTTEITTEETTVSDDSYAPGDFVISTGASLRFRKDHSRTAEHLKSIPNGTKITVTEVYTDTNASNETEKYWGKTVFDNEEGWVCMYYLINPGAANTTTSPAVSTTETESTTEAAQVTTTQAAQEVTTAPVVTTSAPVTQSVQTTAPVQTTAEYSGAYTTGSYYFENPDSKLHLRNGHSVTAQSIADIPSGETLNVTEIFEDATAESDSLKYWGHVQYLDYEGWVCLSVLQKAQ